MKNERIYTIQTEDEETKLIAEESKFIILEKVGDSGDLKIMPRVFIEWKDAISYLAFVEEKIKSSPLKNKNIKYFLVNTDEIKILS